MVTVLDEIFSEGLVVVGSRLQAEYQCGKRMAGLQRVGLEEEPVEPFFGVIESEPPQEGLSGCRAEEGGVAVFRNIDTHHEMLRRSANLVLQLTELPQAWYHRSYP